MDKKLIQKKEKAIEKYYKYLSRENYLFATYWKKKLKKITFLEKLSAALVKRQIATNGIEKLNSIKIN